MMDSLITAEQSESIRVAAREKFAQSVQSLAVKTDRMFIALMILQWVGAIVVAFWISPQTWIGDREQAHPHLVMAVFGGAVLAGGPVLLALLYPGRFVTRLVIGLSQVLFSSLFIHLSGGRIESHFHVFGSLAFLAAYRDWRVLAPATLVVAADHFVRGVWWPESVFGVAMVSQWRWVEHAAWVVFEDIFLLLSIHESIKEMRQLSLNSARLEAANEVVGVSERRFRASFDQAAAGMCHTDLDGRFLRANDRYCEIVGYSNDELRSMRYHDIVDKRDLERNLDQIKQLLNQEVPSVSYERRYVHKSGRKVWVTLTISYVEGCVGEQDYLLAVVQDITEARAAREALEASHQEVRKLSLVASKTRHSVIIADAQGRIEWANEGFTRLTGYSLEEALGNSPGALLQGPETDPETRALVSQRVRAGQGAAVEILNYHKNGAPYWISLEIDPVYQEQGKLTNFIATQTDITERRERTAALQNATEAAQAANRAKSQFLANMSHEIRTPLNGILGFADLLLADDAELSGEERREYLRTVRTSGKHLLMLINDVLDLSKIEAGQLSVEQARCSPHALVAEVVSVLRVKAKEKGVGLEFQWDSSVPETIQTDAHRLKQLLMNLVGNAIKFTKAGSVVLRIAVDESGDDSPKLRIEIRDTGVGIPADRLDAIFEPFVQADNSVTRKFGGTGLGLAISKHIVEALGGELTCESVLGRGSTFRVSVDAGPLDGVARLASAPDMPLSDTADIGVESLRIDGLRVLVADDGETNRDLIRLLLTRAGATVRLCDNGETAVRMALQGDDDVVLMDMQMPIMDGYAATRELRSAGYEVPIIALTANAMKGDRDRCLAAGCSGYLSKPIDMNELIKTLSALPRGRSALAGPATTRSPHAPPAEVVTPAADRMKCVLPMDDPAIREIVEEFLTMLDGHLGEMSDAAAGGDLAELARLAHWLKGAGGTLGFDAFTQPADDLEAAAKEQRLDDAARLVERLRTLAASAEL